MRAGKRFNLFHVDENRNYWNDEKSSSNGWSVIAIDPLVD